MASRADMIGGLRTAVRDCEKEDFNFIQKKLYLQLHVIRGQPSTWKQDTTEETTDDGSWHRQQALQSPSAKFAQGRQDEQLVVHAGCSMPP